MMVDVSWRGKKPMSGASAVAVAVAVAPPPDAHAYVYTCCLLPPSAPPRHVSSW
uniref:Uncharacterized protein n=1 Tax=Zea mays TaxID=4577 RepID=C4J3R5_MAIZE|nr:unknown [Zea mays]